MNDHFSPSQKDGAVHPEFLNDVLTGLSAEQKYLPCRWLYDETGSTLFEEITQLPEYYLTRTETKILSDIAPALATSIGPHASLIEYGAGASVKTRILLDALVDATAYIPIDVSKDFLLQTADQLRRHYPALSVTPIHADFLSPLSVPELEEGSGEGRRVGFFPGSTIGNLSDDEIEQFLTQAREGLGPNSLFILGYDRVKDTSTLIRAYDDAAGVTAAFNLNLLTRINRELGADFQLDQFEHEARWNADQSRIEMHLISKTAQTVQIGAHRFAFTAGETIHTENSRKFTPEQIEELTQRAHYQIRDTYSDPDQLFSVVLLERRTDPQA